ncbi:MAG: hypothetical protein GBAus27B_000468 [Mycoplasmataceae bacterium]|nr:MAG: hypothetical protein GBAus27B_000468 [Mycoplasmataceae bacterium]
MLLTKRKKKTEQALAERGEITPTALTELREAKAKADADLVVANEAKEKTRTSSCWTRRDYSNCFNGIKGSQSQSWRWLVVANEAKEKTEQALAERGEITTVTN